MVRIKPILKLLYKLSQDWLPSSFVLWPLCQLPSISCIDCHVRSWLWFPCFWIPYGLDPDEPIPFSTHNKQQILGRIIWPPLDILLQFHHQWFIRSYNIIHHGYRDDQNIYTEWIISFCQTWISIICWLPYAVLFLVIFPCCNVRPFIHLFSREQSCRYHKAWSRVHRRAND